MGGGGCVCAKRQLLLMPLMPAGKKVRKIRGTKKPPLLVEVVPEKKKMISLFNGRLGRALFL